MGLQFENLVLNNVAMLVKLLRINKEDMLRLGPFYQKKTARQKGCQIDLLIQHRYHTLYLCEIKFSHERVGLTVSYEVAEKQRRLLIPKGWSLRTVLIHVNGVSRELQQNGSFDHLIGFDEMFDDPAIR